MRPLFWQSPCSHESEGPPSQDPVGESVFQKLWSWVPIWTGTGGRSERPNNDSWLLNLASHKARGTLLHTSEPVEGGGPEMTVVDPQQGWGPGWGGSSLPRPCRLGETYPNNDASGRENSAEAGECSRCLAAGAPGEASWRRPACVLGLTKRRGVLGGGGTGNL